MANSFPQVSFDWLGELPGIADQSAQTRAIRETLADLKSTDPASLEAKSAQLLARGATKEGLLLQDAALKQRALAQKGEADRAYSEWLSKNGRGLVPGTGGEVPTPDAPPEIPYGGSSAPAAAPASPFGPNPLAAPQRQSQGPSPSDTLINAAQGGAPAGPGTQLAGPVPTPDTAPAQPEWLKGAQAQPMTQAPTAPQRPTGPDFGPIRSENADARAEYVKAGEALMTLPPKGANTPAGRALQQQFNSAASRLKLDPKERDYQQSRIQRKQEGLPDWSRSDFEIYKQTAPDRLKEANKRYEKYATDADTGRELETKLTRLNEVVNHPKFIAGDFNHLDTAKKWIANFADTLTAHGVQLPQGFRERLTAINEPTALKEAFASVAAQGVIEALGGSLGRGISSSDQQYMSRAFPDLMKSKDGIKIVNEILGEASNRQKLAGKTARDYMQNKELRATQPELDAKVSEALDAYGSGKPLFINQDGSPTALGLRADKIATDNATAGGGARAPAPVAAPAPAPAPVARPPGVQGRAVIGPDGKKYQWINGQLYPEGTQGL